jgi:hypothetical protein
MDSRFPTYAPQVRRQVPPEILPVIGAIFVAGPPVIPAGIATVLLALMLAGPFALVVALCLVFAAAVAVVALAGALLASPYLLVRHVLAQRADHATADTADTAPQRVAVSAQQVLA